MTVNDLLLVTLSVCLAIFVIVLQTQITKTKDRVADLEKELACTQVWIGETMKKHAELENAAENQRIVNGGVEPWQFMQSKNSEGI